MASLVTVCVFLSLSLFCCGQENLPPCASQREQILREAGKQLQVQYIYYTPGGPCTDLTCLKEPGHVNDSFICEDERPYRCYPRLPSSAVYDMYDKCDNMTCRLWQVFTNVPPQVPFCVVYMYTDVSEAVDPCQELKSRRFRRHVSLAPSRDDTTCHSLCSITSADKPQDRNSDVKMEWNFVDKSDRNQVQYRVMNNITSDFKPWTQMSKYYHSRNDFKLIHRNLEIRFDLTDMTSIRRLWISVEDDADITVHCNMWVPDITTTFNTNGEIMVSCNASVPDITPTLDTSIPRENKTFPVIYVVGAVVAVAAITLLSALIIVLYRRHRRLRATPETISDEPDKPSAGCRDAPGPPASPTMQTSRSQYAQVEGEQNNKMHYQQVEPEQARKSHYEQVEPERPRTSQYEQVEPERPRISQYEQVEPERPRISQYEQVDPERPRISQYEQVEPERPRISQYEQVEPERPRISQYEQVDPERPRISQYEQVEPERPRISQYEQVDPERPRTSQYEQVEPERPRISQYEQVEPERPRISQYEQVELEQAMTFTAGRDKDRLSSKHRPGDTTMYPGSRNRKAAKDEAGYDLVPTPVDFDCVESSSCSYGHLGRKQATVRGDENVYNHPVNQVTGQSVHNNGQVSAQGAEDLYDELLRDRRMVVIGNVYGTTGLVPELGAAPD